MDKKLDDKNLQKATFAGGCFWCTESDFEKIDGVVEVISGYTGGDEKDPTYKQVSSGATGHYEAVQVYYDPLRITYAELLDVFWRHVNPTDAGGHFVDRGPQFHSAPGAGKYCGARGSKFVYGSHRGQEQTWRFPSRARFPGWGGSSNYPIYFLPSIRYDLR